MNCPTMNVCSHEGGIIVAHFTFIIPTIVLCVRELSKFH